MEEGTVALFTPTHAISISSAGETLLIEILLLFFFQDSSLSASLYAVAARAELIP